MDHKTTNMDTFHAVIGYYSVKEMSNYLKLFQGRLYWTGV